MSTRTFTFDPDAGVPVGADLTIHTGSTFKSNYNVQDDNSSTYDLTDWSGSSQMQKGVGIGATTVPAGTRTDRCVTFDFNSSGAYTAGRAGGMYIAHADAYIHLESEL